MFVSAIAVSNVRGKRYVPLGKSAVQRSERGASPTRATPVAAAPPKFTAKVSDVEGQSCHVGNSERPTVVVGPSSVHRRGETKTERRSLPFGATPFGRAVKLIVSFLAIVSSPYAVANAAA